MTPPQMFGTGDHEIVHPLGDVTGWVDPSYGMPQSDTPYPNMESGWEPASVAGFAVVFCKENGKFEPLPIGSDVLTKCATHVCQFRAVPYSQSGAPSS